MNEFEIIDRFVAGLPRPSGQLNAVHESDCELIWLPSGGLPPGGLPPGETILAMTTDDLVEELALGLYPDPFTVGWVAVTASASDLAAVGADPLAALVSLGIPIDFDPGYLDGVACGVASACRAASLGIAGGDTNTTPEFRIGCMAVGTVPRGAVLTRRGCHPGDLLFSTGPLGAGAILALARLSANPAPAFRPTARIPEGRSLRSIASSCIDTSDGALDALGRLARLNGVGFDLDLDPARAAAGGSAPVAGPWDPGAIAALRAEGLPDWLLLASLHGEFELLFTVPPRRISDLLQAACAAGWRPVPLGRASAEPGIRLHSGGTAGDARPGDTISLDPLAARRLFDGFAGDFRNLIAGLLTLPRS